MLGRPERTADIIQYRYTRVTVCIVANKCVNLSPISIVFVNIIYLDNVYGRVKPCMMEIFVILPQWRYIGTVSVDAVVQLLLLHSLNNHIDWLVTFNLVIILMYKMHLYQHRIMSKYIRNVQKICKAYYNYVLMYIK